MKKFSITFLFFLGCLFAHSDAAAQSLETDNKIAKAFLAMLDGTEDKAMKAITEFGSKEVIANGMIPFGNAPKITKVDENCVYFTLFDADEEENDYYICTEGDKIVTFEWQD